MRESDPNNAAGSFSKNPTELIMNNTPHKSASCALRILAPQAKLTTKWFRGVATAALTWVMLSSLTPMTKAQSNTGGYIFGSGATAGATIVTESIDSGGKRETKADAGGAYRIPGLSPGRYNVTLRSASGDQTVENVLVSIGTGVSVRFGSKDIVEMAKFAVSAGSISPIDLSSVESVTIITAKTISELPVARNTTAVALLAPGTTQGVAAFGNLVSFGGSSVGENTYYVNGFNLTNHRNGLGGGTVPFEFYDQFQVKTGGYGAEFGRSTGGVINATTKKGGNTFKAGLNVVWTPDRLVSHAPSVFQPNGTPYVNRDGGYSEAISANLYAGGPIVKNKVFYFGLIEARNSTSKGPGITTYSKSNSKDPFFAGKLDWSINDNHSLEVTAISDRRDTASDSWNYTYATKGIGSYRGSSESKRGGKDYIFRYNGKFSDSFTASALFGRSTADFTDATTGDAFPYILDARSGTALLIGNAINLSTSQLLDTRKVYRLDGEYGFNLGVQHRLRFGLDREEVGSDSVVQYSGGGLYWRYVVTAPSRVLANGGIVPAGVTQYARKRIYQNSGKFQTEAQAYYLEDNVKLINNRLVLSAGLRDETFNNKNSRSETFVKMDGQWAPRLGASFDLQGDGKSKVFANWGRYHLPVATNTNIRLAGGELYYEEYYALNSLNADSTPNIGAQIGGRTYFADGSIKDPQQIVDKKLKPMYQDEIIIGYQRALNKNWTAGIRGTYRKVQRFIEDMAVDETLNVFARAQGIPASKFNAGGNDYYVLGNPGQPVTFAIDMNDGKGVREITLSAKDLRFPTAQRQYAAAEVFFERLYDGKWMLQGSYTHSYSWGNDEGSVLSDNGQSDAGLTVLFDHPGLMDHSTGYLANDKRHKFKLFGSYSLTKQFQAGANLRLESGTPLNAFGFHPTDAFAAAYGADSFFNNGIANSRGSAGRSPWITQIDLNMKYRPEWGKNKVSFTISAFNILNSHKWTEMNQVAEIGLKQPNPTYGLPTSFQSPRSARLMMSYDY